MQVLKRQTTSKEFSNWKYYLQNLPNEFEPLHYYLAQIAMFVVKTQNPKKKVALEDFILKFVPKKISKADPKDQPVSEEQKKRNRSFVLGMVGLKPDGTVNPDVKRRPVVPKRKK